MAGAELQAEANLRVRGTWEHPILLGHIHILSGNLYFAEIVTAFARAI